MKLEYSRYINNKRVVFVGASPILKGRKLGDWIDSFDIVVRSNNAINLTRDRSFSRDYGSHTDVLYTNNQFYREMKPLPVDEWHRWGLLWLCMKKCNQQRFIKMQSHLNVRMLTDVIRGVAKLIPSAHMGCFIYTDLLNCRPKELHVTGVDFFASKKKVFEIGNYQEYVPGYLPDKIAEIGNIINVGKKADGHDFRASARYIWDLKQKYKNFTMPQFVEEILNGIVAGEIDQQ